MPGVDDLRILVVRRESTGPDSWTGTVAAVMRSANRVGVLTWDLMTDDDPPALDSGFVTLARVAEARLTGVDENEIVVSESVFLAPDDPAVVAAIGPGAPHAFLGGTGIPWMNPRCNHAFTSPQAGVVASRAAQLLAPGGDALMVEFAFRYGSTAVADVAVGHAEQSVDDCPDPLLEGTQQELELHLPAGVTGRGWGADYTEPGSGEKTRFRGYVRSGDLVAYLLLDSAHRNVTPAQATAVLEAMAQRLASSG